MFVADFYKTSIAGEKNRMPSLINESVERMMVEIFDCGLAMGQPLLRYSPSVRSLMAIIIGSALAKLEIFELFNLEIQSLQGF